MKTKEEITDQYSEYLIDFGFAMSIDDSHKAMDEWAKQQAIAFAIHYATTAIGWGHTKADDVKNDRMEERYTHFIENQNK